MALKLQLCNVGTLEDVKHAKTAERKLDGRRAVIVQGDQNKRIIGRQGNDITNDYPELQAITLPPNTIIDGEITVGSTFNDLQNHANTHEPATFNAFDLILLKGKDERNQPLRERRNHLENLGIHHPRYHLVEQGTPQALWEQAEKENWEGVILKNGDAPYTQGRSDNWIKVKRYKETTVPVLSYDSNKKPVSAIETTLGRCNVASPLHTQIILDAFAKGVKLEAQIDYLELSKNGKMRFPILKQLEVIK